MRPAGTQPAGSVQWVALDHSDRRTVAADANDLPPWYTVHQQAQRWLAAGVFEHIVDDLRTVLRLAEGRTAQPSAVVIDSRTVQSTPESGADAGYDGAKRRRGRKVHLAVDTLAIY